ncbi:YheC/YheD family protein [Bacillus haikouensis]|uniref:YheC/YheD family endospore coat-associated protein n=1 Tax=Bacillus haikouensis TaxID=1510468 RepID=UPI001551D802|nr:YheC/YheD family protein [Bacillus haikouensis]NQD65543.1 YheC/YheD family protein [Bacillus haikouensis]
MNYSLGIMTLNPDLSNPYFKGIGKQSLPFNNDLYLFSPHDISPVNETVEGFAFDRESGNWKKEIFDIPSFIYDRTYYDKSLQSRQAKAVVQWLKNQPHIRFLGYGLPNKWLMYEKLTSSPLSSYIPETFLIKNHSHLLNLLIKYKDIIIKPVDGANGFAVYHLILSNNEVTVRTTKNYEIAEQSFPSKAIFMKWAERMLEQHTFIAQERIHNRTELDTPFDIRILLNKDQFGEWREFQRAIREGTRGGIVTNISRGGTYYSQEEWESIHPEADWTFIGTELNAMLIELPDLLEDYFSPLFELGVDVLLAQDGSLWILDINSKPGHKIVDTLGIEKLDSLHQSPLEYCEHLYSISLPSLRRGDF